MTEDLAAVLQRPAGRDDDKPQVAVGGTLFGNPLSMVAARAAMSEVLTDDASAHSQRLGTLLADGPRGTSTPTSPRSPGSSTSWSERGSAEASGRAVTFGQSRASAAGAVGESSRSLLPARDGSLR